MRIVKSITRFDELPGLPRTQCDRHYEDIHTRFIRQNFRLMPQAVTYHPQRAVAQLDPEGGWTPETDAWRYVVSRFDASIDAGPQWRAIIGDIEQDHTRFMSNMRLSVVREEVMVDRLCGQTSLEKYLLEVDADTLTDVGRAQEALRRFADRAAPTARTAYGIRLLILNEVEREGVSEPLTAPGQSFGLGRYLSATDKIGYVEFYGDQREWMEEFFAGALCEHLTALRRTPGVGRCDLYRVRETCGIDHREPPRA